MTFPRLFPVLAVLALASAQAAEEAPPATPKPGLMNRLLHPFGGGKSDEKGKDTKFKNLEMKVTLDPAVAKLSESRTLKVTVMLKNTGKKLVQLDFPTTQRIEVLVKNKAGKRVAQWSEDQAFTNDPSIVAINPGERLEYTANVSTRDFVAGETYTLEAFFPNFEALRDSRTVTAEK
jgi:archaellum component FlaG (FlaF/FlaG flagellin family)